MKLNEYMYVDEAMISGLFSQQTERTPVGGSTIDEQTKGISGGFGLTTTVGNIFKALGLDLGANGEVRRDRQRRQSTTQDYTVSIENKAEAVMRYLAGQRTLYKDLYSAVNAAGASSGSAFCDIDEEFTPLGWAPQDDEWVLRANRDQFLILFAALDPDVKVGMSFQKIFELRDREIRARGHLYHRFRANGRRRLRVFGSIDTGRYIKPYAVIYK